MTNQEASVDHEAKFENDKIVSRKRKSDTVNVVLIKRMFFPKSEGAQPELLSEGDRLTVTKKHYEEDQKSEYPAMSKIA